MCKLPGPKECLPILFLATKSSLVWKMDNKLNFWVALWIILHSVYHINHWPDLTSAHCTAIAIPTILDLTFQSPQSSSILHKVTVQHLALFAAPFTMCSTVLYVQNFGLCGVGCTIGHFCMRNCMGNHLQQLFFSISTILLPGFGI